MNDVNNIIHITGYWSPIGISKSKKYCFQREIHDRLVTVGVVISYYGTKSYSIESAISIQNPTMDKADAALGRKIVFSRIESGKSDDTKYFGVILIPEKLKVLTTKPHILSISDAIFQDFTRNPEKYVAALKSD